MEPKPRTPIVSRPIAVAGSVVPGMLVHGTGSWLTGDSETGKTLLLAEGIGFGLTAGSITGLALTGAARDYAGLFISTAIVGMGLFTLSFFADVYHTAVPHPFGQHPGSVPWMTTEVGLLWIDNPRLRLGPVVVTSTTLRWDRWSASLLANQAPAALHSSMRLEAGYRLLGAPTGRGIAPTGGSHLTAHLAFEDSRYRQASYLTRGAELRLTTRVDSEDALPNVAGAFFEGELGYARRRTRYEIFDTSVGDSLLLGGFGFGVYHGDPTTCGGETRIYYDHRHDGYAAGLLMAGLGSGTIGHFGVESTHFFSPTWGIRTNAEIGAAAVFGVHLVARAWSGSGADAGSVRF